MQFLFLFLTPLFFGCSNDPSVDDWVAPSLQILNGRGGEAAEIKTVSEHSINDYLTFKNKDGLDASGFTVRGESSCTSTGEPIHLSKEVAHLPFQFKSIVSPQVFLETASADCNFEIEIRNSSGSTKKYSFAKKITTADHLSEINLPAVIDFTEFHNTHLPTASSADQIEVYCEKLVAEGIVQMLGGASLGNLLLQDRSAFEDIPTQTYYPHQNCRVVVRSLDATRWSYPILLKFKKLRPDLTLENGKEPFRFLLNFTIHFSNPFASAMTFAVKKSDFKYNAVCRGHCKGSANRHRGFEASLTWSDQSQIKDHGEYFIVHLKSGARLDLKVQVTGNVNFMAQSHYVPDFNKESVGAYSLSHNLRKLEDLADVELKILDKFYVH